MPKAIGAVLFDLDGTLADTALDLGYALNLQRQRHGLPEIPHTEIRPKASHGARTLLKLGFDISSKSPEFDDLYTEYLDLYLEHICDKTVLFPGTAELLLELEARGIPWGVVTNKPARFTLPLLKALNLEQRAACIISGDSTPRPKPHPDPLLMAAGHVRMAPAACLYVGDAERDVEAANAAGMRAIIANYGYLSSKDQPDTWGAHGRIDTPQEILNYF